MEAAPLPRSGRHLLRLPAVLARIPLSRTRIYELIAEGRFPPQIRLSDRASAWDEAEINQWLDERVRKSREPAA